MHFEISITNQVFIFLEIDVEQPI